MIARHLRNFIFDYDGTLARVPVEWGRERNRFRDRFLATLPSDNVPEDARVDQMESMVLNAEPSCREEVFRFRRDLEQSYDGLHIPLDTGLKLLGDYQSQYREARFFVVSNNMRATVNSGLHQLGITQHFLSVLGVDDCGLPKPAQQAARLLATKFNVSPEDTLFIGDNQATDGEFSRRAGYQFVDVTLI